MLRRVVSVLRRQPALGRSALAVLAALGLALACLNPQNDDLPSNNFDGASAVDPNAQAAGNDRDDAPSPDNAPESPGNAPPAAPLPAPNEGDSAEPTSDPGLIDQDDGADAEAPDAGADAGGANAPDDGDP